MSPGAAGQGSGQGCLPPSLETRESPPLSDRSQPHGQHPCRPTSRRTQDPRVSRLRLPDFGGLFCGRRSLGSPGGGGLCHDSLGRQRCVPSWGSRVFRGAGLPAQQLLHCCRDYKGWKALASGTVLGSAWSPARGLSGRVMTAPSPGSFLGREPEAGMAGLRV